MHLSIASFYPHKRKVCQTHLICALMAATAAAAASTAGSIVVVMLLQKMQSKLWKPPKEHFDKPADVKYVKD